MLRPSLLLPLLLSVVKDAAGLRSADACRPTCSQVLPRLPEVRRWCSAVFRQPAPETVLACGAAFSDAQPPSEREAMLVATSVDYEALSGRNTSWTVCNADRISYRILSHAYFGAVWEASANPCRERYAVWLVTHNAPPCWHHNTSESLSDRTINQETAMSLKQNRTYQCRHCSFTSHTESDFLGENYTYVIANDEIPTLFRYLSCNENSRQPYPTLRVVDSFTFTCEGCRRWIDFAEENPYEFRGCKTETEDSSTKTAVEHAEGLPGICKTMMAPRTLPSTEETTTSWLDSQTTRTEATNTIRDRVEEALEQLEPKTIEDGALKNKNRTLDPDQMLTNLDTIINFSNNLTQNNVSLALTGFELFAKTILMGNTTAKGKAVKVKHEHSTLVIASGIVGALVSTDGENIELLRHGKEDYSVEWMLARSGSVGVVLPEETGVSAAAIAITVLRHDLLNTSFLDEGLHVNSDVISVQVETWNSSLPAKYVDVFLKPRVRGVRRRCGIWNSTTNAWDFGSCTLYRRGQVIDVCRCWHLTHFAQLVTDTDLQWGDHAGVLELISLAGVFASLLGTIGLGVAAALDHKWRRKPGTRVLLQLGSAVAARDLLLAVAAVDAFRPSSLWRPEDPDACRWLGVALHYALLAAAAWTTAAAVLQLLRLGTIIGAQALFPHVVLVSSACSWLSPLVPVVALVATSGLEAGYPLRQDSATEFLCYPQGVALYTTVVFPVALCTAANAAIFLYLLLVVLFPVRQDEVDLGIRQHSTVSLRRRALTSVVLFFLLGLPWLLGPPARLLVLAYLFCIIATPQGMALFVFFVVCNGRLRKSICATISCAAFSSFSSSTGTGYSRSPLASNNTRINNSVSDTPPVRNRRNVGMRDELELSGTEGGPYTRKHAGRYS
ncbi:uncharacterized protein LOC124776884 isoform X1 [Schistocerca piceifrons]|uniref:uncharacterized protein LOC124776884 isoform X1 n=1 Tax=Schistocerca piceifrons TaxID=274613 RepID=UPI001F5EB4E6|nr:uncharacterized protein LOC124776884 isoform X1 [Schistocerca piceifrons]